VKALSLFSGIGGLDLAAESCGIQTSQFVEIDPYCQRVLARHWPNVPIHDDITTFTAQPGFDIVHGGFPCQDLSNANKTRVGLNGKRSGLFREFVRVSLESGAKWLVFENSSELIGTYWEQFRTELEREGFAVAGRVVHNPSFHRRARAAAFAYPSHLGGAEKVQQAVSALADIQRDSKGQNTEPAGVLIVRRAGADPLFLAGDGGRCLAFPVLVRTNDGVPNRLERCRALGNAVDPRQFAPVFQALMRVEQS